MIVVNLFGGPGVGKSTTAAMLFAHYKRRGITTELLREPAKELLYQGRDLSRNQVLLMALHYQALKDYEAAGTQLVIADTALLLNLVYSQGLPFYAQLERLVLKLTREFKEVDVLIKRAVPYQEHGRNETEAEARAIDEAVRDRAAYDVVTGPEPLEVIARVDPLVLPLLSSALF